MTLLIVLLVGLAFGAGTYVGERDKRRHRRNKRSYQRFLRGEYTRPER